MNLAKTFTAARFFLAAVFSVAASCAFCAEDRIWDDRPGDNWENSWYPLGNGRLGCMVDGGARKLRIQFNVDSLWTGDKNLTNDIGDDRADANYKTMGAYQNFGELEIELPKLPDGEVTDYRRELNLESAMYNDKFKVGKVEVRRLAFASVPDDAIFIVVCSPWTSDDAFELKLSGAHGESVSSDGRAFCGTLANGLDYAARVDVFTFPPEEGFSVKVFSISAATGVKSIPPKKIDGPYVVKRHFVEYGHYYDRMTLDLGEGDKTVPTRTRLERVKKGGKDPALIALMFNFGRYLLISSSRPGTLPANLQGIWNNSNKPAWHCDYHTNINIQMNYWGADSANLSDCFTPLSDWMLKSLPVAEAGTRAAFPNSKGYAYRTSANAVGGGGWRWNFAGAPWMAAQCYDHYLFTRDRKYLEKVCWPLMKGAAEFMISTQLKERPDGTIVVKDGWSPEHGPREDGVAHDQQIMRELFRSILAAAKELKIDDAFVKEVARIEPKLLKDKIGSWGQLQEWETDRDQKGDQHRHTSHLYAVYPGSTISPKATPELAEAAKVALAGRTLTGDSRRSWTWPWRAALWARLGEGDKAGEMLDSLLRYNTLDNMFATHPPFQIDGNLGMVAAVCEMLMERAIPSSWPHGSAKGLRTREGKVIDVNW
ncbi:MAG: glycoside hydrolase N-terminal domain-containing protein [Kiritimatiellae bacterium]|nr:glycoside hydrolase N-terminal domain-containing protein [Kiritimatiellia bacterium]